MAANFIARLRSLGSSAFRLAAALTMASVATAAVGFAAYWAYTYPERQQSKQAEIVRAWSNDLSSNLGMKLRTRTKVVDGMMHIALEFNGYPEFLKRPANSSRGFILEWKDADGFTRIKKFVQVSEFSTTVNGKGEAYGLNGQFSQFVSIADYSRLESMEVGWNVETETPQQRQAAPAPTDSATPDHCAPGLSRQERLRRLGQHGQVRHTGLGEYTAAGRVVHYLGDGNELYECR